MSSLTADRLNRAAEADPAASSRNGETTTAANGGWALHEERRPMKYRVAAAAVLAAAALLFGCLSGCKGKAKPDHILSANISSDGKIAVTAHGDSRSIQIWNVETGKRIRTIKRLRGVPVWVDISPDGKTIASISSPSRRKIEFQRSWTNFVVLAKYLNPRDTIQLWDVATGDLIQTLKEDDVEYITASFSPDGKTFVSVELGGGSKLWNAQTGELIRRLSMRNPVYAFSPDGRLLAGTKEDAIQLLNAETGKTIAEISTKMSAGVLHFSPDGKTLAHVKIKEPVPMWDVETRAALPSLENPAGYHLYDVVFSPDGTRAAAVALDIAAGTFRVLLWDVKTGKIVKTLRRSDRVVSVAFTEDGSEIVGITDDLQMVRWKLKQ